MSGPEEQRQAGTDNPLKAEGIMGKATTRREADRGDSPVIVPTGRNPRRTRRSVDNTITRQGGSHKGGRDEKADSSHPSHHGGEKHELDERGRQRG